jgi:hypothetical protein
MDHKKTSVQKHYQQELKRYQKQIEKTKKLLSNKTSAA